MFTQNILKLQDIFFLIHQFENNVIQITRSSEILTLTLQYITYHTNIGADFQLCYCKYKTNIANKMFWFCVFVTLIS